MTTPSQPESPKPYSPDELDEQINFDVKHGMRANLKPAVILDAKRLKATAEHLRSLELQVARLEAKEDSSAIAIHDALKLIDELEARVQRYEAPVTDEEALEMFNNDARNTFAKSPTDAMRYVLEAFLSGRRERAPVRCVTCNDDVDYGVTPEAHPDYDHPLRRERGGAK